jgi:hypothetical protein
MSIRNISLGGKGGRWVGLTLPPSTADCHEIWEPQPPGTLRACPGMYRDCFTFTFTLLNVLLQKQALFLCLTSFYLLIVGVRHKRIIAVQRRDLYLTTHNTHKRQTSMPPAVFELAIPASKWPQSCALDHAATGIGKNNLQDKNSATFS